ncbi:MAG: STAS-like domain-containing protein [Prevotella sp.]|nr:STAS-like domain-containing protein [Prevotella sp.]
MEKKIIKLNTIYSADLYTRSRASELRSCINKDATEVVLDFEGIGFMSRSFADEVCNIVDDNKDIKFEFVNRNKDVDAMMTKVAESRSQERKRGISNAKMTPIRLYFYHLLQKVFIDHWHSCDRKSAKSATIRFQNSSRRVAHGACAYRWQVALHHEGQAPEHQANQLNADHDGDTR